MSGDLALRSGQCERWWRGTCGGVSNGDRGPVEMVKRQPAYYPCLGYCMVDARGVCVACGRPPSLGLPEVCATAKKSSVDSNVADGALPTGDSHDKPGR